MSQPFQLGEEASQSALRGALEAVRSAGDQVVTSLDAAWDDSLQAFDRKLAALNSRQQRCARVLAPGTVLRFTLADLLDIDQGSSTASLRVDAQVATLRERSQSRALNLRRCTFTASAGNTELLDAATNLYRVQADSVPEGVFELEFSETLNLSLLVFDIAAQASQPEVDIEVSSSGVVYTAARAAALSGYRLTAWLGEQKVRFVRLKIRPSHPDNLGGSSYTFGLTQVNGSVTEYHLRSEALTRLLSYNAGAPQVRFQADGTAGVGYFLSLAGGEYREVQPGDILDVPGASTVAPVTVGLDINGQLAHTLAAGAYLNSLRVQRADTGASMRLAPGLGPGDTRLSKLAGQYIGVAGSNLYLLLYSVADAGRNFTLSYAAGPSTVTAQLRVVFSSNDRGSSPLFRGASLQEV